MADLVIQHRLGIRSFLGARKVVIVVGEDLHSIRALFRDTLKKYSVSMLSKVFHISFFE